MNIACEQNTHLSRFLISPLASKIQKDLFLKFQEHPPPQWRSGQNVSSRNAISKTRLPVSLSAGRNRNNMSLRSKRIFTLKRETSAGV